jgi:hypothetical protein
VQRAAPVISVGGPDPGRLGTTLAAAALALILAACGSGAGPAPTGAASPIPSTVAASATAPGASPAGAVSPGPTIAGGSTQVPTPSAPVATGAFSLTAEVWFSGYDITLTGGSYDPARHTLVIDATFRNTSTQQTELRQLSASVKVVWDNQYLVAYVSAGTVPIGASVDGQIQVDTPKDFVPAEAMLAFGEADEHQALVPLGGAAATSDQPVALALSGTLKMGKYISYRITSSLLVPAACIGYPDRIRFGPLKADLTSILLWGTAVSTDPVNDAHIDQGYVVLPDGTTIQSDPTTGLEIPYKATIRNVGLCFAVPLPATGTDVLKMHEYRSKATGKLQLVIP